MERNKPEAPIATLMKTIDSGVSFSVETTASGTIRVETPTRRAELDLATAKDVLAPASQRRPKRPLNSPPIENFENDLHDCIRKLDMVTTQTKPRKAIPGNTQNHQ